MKLKRSWTYGLLALGLAAGVGTGTLAMADDPPSQAEIDFAAGASQLMLNDILGALVTEFGQTTPANAEQGKRGISLIFHNRNRDMRLVGTVGPLQDNNRPSDSFETSSLALAMTGQNHTNVEKVKGQWFYRQSIALSNFHDACVMCHPNFGPKNPAQWVGALMLRVPIGSVDFDKYQ